MRIDNLKKHRVPVFRFIILASISIGSLFPILMLVNVSLKTRQELNSNPFGFAKSMKFENYVTVFNTAKIPRGFLNSLIITLISLAVLLIFGSLAAYALSKMNFSKSKIFSSAFLAPMVFPIQIIPLYLMFQKLGLINNYGGLIIVYAATGLPFVIFILTSFMKTIPYQISEAAFIEGAPHFKVYSMIILPLLKPVLSTIVIISGLTIWNDFFLPLVLMNKQSMKTLPLTIYTFTDRYNNNWPLICTCIVFIAVPVLIVYIILQKYIIDGVIAGSVKG